MKLLFYFLVILSFLSTYCSDTLLDSERLFFELSDTLTIKYNQIFFNESEELSIKFEAINSDRRCPIDVTCVWEGDAELNYSFSSGNEKVNFHLHTAGSYFSKDTLMFGYNIELIDVYPYPHSKKEIKVEEYEAKMLIKKVSID